MTVKFSLFLKLRLASKRRKRHVGKLMLKGLEVGFDSFGGTMMLILGSLM